MPMALFTTTTTTALLLPPPSSSSSVNKSSSFHNFRVPFTVHCCSLSPIPLSHRFHSLRVRMAPEEEKMTRRSPLDFPIVCSFISLSLSCLNSCAGVEACFVLQEVLEGMGKAEARTKTGYIPSI
ncbi:uncharacterized protein LOC107618852 isoform X3 [Arachis ipaensis]|uniref:uncharacterized protein LOC107618852 isoform X3 n=1 Tax=Arachis ipaensis TaxID=130454 RepID=UPI000A2B0724|nr:uncharacterized protein LOC107618852 isoform X3 [Arachis ipaensis]XP_025675833.1 uncharacterized protein LOC112776071 isoform X3 [Arachis hypogaea]